MLLPLLQALTRRNILVAAVGAAATVWLYDMLYEERVAQKVVDKRGVTRHGWPTCEQERHGGTGPQRRGGAGWL